MADTGASRVDEAWDYARDCYKDKAVLDEFERLARYSPETFAGYMDLRRAAFKTEEEGSALPLKVKELVAVGAELIAYKTNPPPVGHARKAIDAGATVREIAEVIGIAIMLGGMMTFRESGRFVLKAAEDRARELGRA